jgi:hypothetical protein
MAISILGSALATAAKNAARIAAARSREREELLHRLGYRCPACDTDQVPVYRAAKDPRPVQSYLRTGLLGLAYRKVAHTALTCPSCGIVPDLAPWLANTEFASDSGAGPSCRSCGSTQPPLSRRRGNGVLEVFLYFTWIIPGICYTLWRNRGRFLACPGCGARSA